MCTDLSRRRSATSFIVSSGIAFKERHATSQITATTCFRTFSSKSNSLSARAATEGQTKTDISQRKQLINHPSTHKLCRWVMLILSISNTSTLLSFVGLKIWRKLDRWKSILMGKEWHYRFLFFFFFFIRILEKYICREKKETIWGQGKKNPPPKEASYRSSKTGSQLCYYVKSSINSKT